MTTTKKIESVTASVYITQNKKKVQLIKKESYTAKNFLSARISDLIDFVKRLQYPYEVVYTFTAEDGKEYNSMSDVDLIGMTVTTEE